MLGTQARMTVMGWTHWLMPWWSKIESIISEAKRLNVISHSTNTWDCKDMIDREYYVCSTLFPC